MDEVTTLVHHVYGAFVAQGEAGHIKTHNHVLHLISFSGWRMMACVSSIVQTDISTALTVMSKLDSDKSGFVAYDEFVLFNRSHPQLLFPAFLIQVVAFSVNGP